jgi:hypothetical protein
VRKFPLGGDPLRVLVSSEGLQGARRGYGLVLLGLYRTDEGMDKIAILKEAANFGNYLLPHKFASYSLCL